MHNEETKETQAEPDGSSTKDVEMTTNENDAVEDKDAMNNHAAAPSPPTTRSTRSSKRPPSRNEDVQGEAKRAKTATNNNGIVPNNNDNIDEIRRPKAHECLEDYVEFAANLMLPSAGAGAPSYHALPTMSALRFLTNPKRRRTVWEDWSPYQVSLFEAGIAHYGKDFYAISKEFNGRKSTKQIIDFYYIWKKTSHYKKWKKTYLPAHLDVSDDEQEPSATGKDGSSNGRQTSKGKG